MKARKLLSLFTAAALIFSLSATAFAADDSLTRAELVDLVIGYAGLSTQKAAAAAEASVFADVAEGSAYEGAVNLAAEKGLINGVGGGKFNPGSKITQREAAAIILRFAGVENTHLAKWPKDVDEAAVWSGLTDGYTYNAAAGTSKAMAQSMLAAAAEVGAKPVIGLTWSYDGQDEEYAYYKSVVKEAGGIPVELDQVMSDAVGYDAEDDILPAYIDATGQLKQAYADEIKARNYGDTNIAEAMKDIDGVFFIGGEDISPSLFKVPVAVDNEGEGINATRDISDYTYMAYCIDKDIPTLAACRGEQMMGIVCGVTFIQDIPNYYEDQGIAYNHAHRMPPGTPNRDYERHDIVIEKDSKWMYNIVGSTELKNVSSWHHQAVDSVEGTGLTVVASTNVNGIEIVEALEYQANTFCLGVQFHPENDASLVLWDKNPEAAKCDYDTCLQFFEELVAYAADKPVIGITWKSNTQNYEAFKEVIRAAGGIPVELDQVTSTAVKYDANGKILDSYLEESGMLKQTYADKIKAKNFSKSNVEAVMEGIDGVFFTGGEDVSPSLFAQPQAEANEGEEINATRDISDYTLMAYCIENDVPTLGACRGEQVLSIVAGAGFIQDIPNYFEDLGVAYDDTHRMPVGTPNRTYARHSVTIDDDSEWLYDIVGDTKLDNVSSWHHQTVGSVEGTDLTVVATATVNGVETVEAVEIQGNTFCLGVQFHPENDAKLVLVDGKEAPCDFDTCLKFFETLVDYASGKPVIGITWKSNTQNYEAFKEVIRAAGGIPVELDQVTSTAVKYDTNGKILDSYLEESGMLKQTYANKIKAKDFSKSNVADVMKSVDGVFFTGGEDVSPSLFAKPQVEANEGEEINATRDISDYTLMAYCIENDIPTLGACRGEQVLSIVAGAGFIQDIPNYFEDLGVAYDDTHRMPVGTPNRTYARHSVTIDDDSEWLYDIVGDTKLDNVSSWHHQTVGSVEGTDLTVVATATVNGVETVEAVEIQGNTFCLGVQFHPENDAKMVLVDGVSAPCDFDVCLNFFKTLVSYAAG